MGRLRVLKGIRMAQAKDTNVSAQNTSSGKHGQGGNKQFAILFTDVKGSSAFYKDHGNIAGRIMIQKLNDMLFPIVRAYKGTIVKTIGDSIMAYFFSAKDALWAGISMQKRLQAHNREHDKPEDQLLIRVAMNYGFGIVEERDVFGDVVNVAGKLISQCEAQQILITEALYQEVANTAEVGFAKHDISSRGPLGSVQIYQVEWKKLSEADENTLYLLSLRIEAASLEVESTGGIDKVAFFIEHRSDKTVTTDEHEVNVYFRDGRACLETARKSLQQYLDSSAEESDLPQVVRIGLHAVDAKKVGDGNVLPYFDGAVNARDHADPYEIMLSSHMYEAIPEDCKATCVPVKNRQDSSRPLYVLQGGDQDREKTIFTAILPAEAAARPGATACFYCGCTQHATSKCPSKPIGKPTQYLDALGYLPMQKMRQSFQESFADIVRPLKSGAEEERFELLFRENKKDPYTLCFFAFYEISSHFQLRALKQLYQETAANKEHPAKKSGSVLMGEDCLRVSRYEEAGDWFEKAVAEQPNDYRPHVALGILSMEKNNPEKAVFHFNKALSFSLNNMQKRQIYLLLARVYDVINAIPEAQQELQKILGTSHEWNDGRYYYAVLLVKAGKIKQALEIFKKLIYQSPRYYFMVALNPQLNVAKKEIVAFLNRELISLRARSQKSFTSMQKTIEEHQSWFHKDDADFQAAIELYQRASDIFRSESIAGLIDIPGLEMNVDILIRRALQYRQVNLRKKISGFKKHIENHEQYLKRFPYKNVLSDKDHKVTEHFKQVLEEARKTADTVPPPSPQDAQQLLENLSREAGRLDSHLFRLEILKKMIFAAECTSKMVGVFTVIATLTALFFTVVLTCYEGYETSFNALSSVKILGFAKFGVFAGMFSGIVGSMIWLAKNFQRLQNKL